MKSEAAKKNKKNIIILVIILLAGIALLLYPVVSNYWNSFHQSKIIAGYAQAAAELDDDAYQTLWEEAQAYNHTLLKKEDRFHPGAEEKEIYEKLLNISGHGMIGYVKIPSIGVLLPIYHGTDREVLQTAIGHIQGTSLPVGGTGTHCVISGHRGLPSSKLFTDLDQLTKGDIFILYVLDETLTYEVDQIHITEPDDLSLLEIEENEDFCTLMTCTPYGVNSHRLLVRGHRIENQAASAIRITADAALIDPKLTAPIMAVPVLLIFLLLALFGSLRKR